MKGFVQNFKASLEPADPSVKPSSVLFVPGSHYVYAGGSNGRLYEIDVAVATAPVVKSIVLGDGTSVVGAPSLDKGFVPTSSTWERRRGSSTPSRSRCPEAGPGQGEGRALLIS